MIADSYNYVLHFIVTVEVAYSYFSSLIPNSNPNSKIQELLHKENHTHLQPI